MLTTGEARLPGSRLESRTAGSWRGKLGLPPASWAEGELDLLPAGSRGASVLSVMGQRATAEPQPLSLGLLA